jgi:hypothetical protein
MATTHEPFYALQRIMFVMSRPSIDLELATVHTMV